MTIDGESENININGANINGELEIGGTANHVNIMGRVSTLDVNAAACTGTFNGSCATITNAGPDFRIMSNAASAWLASLTSDVLNVTGNGASYTILFDTEVFDRGSNYSAATGLATITQAGMYLIKGSVTFLNLTSNITRIEARIIRRNSSAVEQQRAYRLVNPTGNFVTGGFYSLEVSEQFFVNEGDTFEIQAFASGEVGDTIDLEGSDLLTTFSGKLLP